MVYFLQERGYPAGPVKIGVSIGGRPALIERIKNLQAGNPRHLVCVSAMKGGFDEEKRVHWRCERQRIRGEWFHFDGPVRDIVNAFRLKKPVGAVLEKDQKAPVKRSLLGVIKGAGGARSSR